MKAVIRGFIAPAIIGKSLDGIEDYYRAVDFIKGNNHAKAAVETALWDLESKMRGLPLWKLVGGTDPAVEVGVSIGIQTSVDALLKKIEDYLTEGYRRIKIKIEPGKDVDTVCKVRKAFPDISLMVDANSSYRLKDSETLARLDEHHLLMMEQPLAEDDIIDHGKLQSAISTPICLDESIHTPDDARKAIELKSCRIINIKYGRVGGLLNSVRIHDICMENGIGNWAGGMIETGIGQRFKIALSTLPNFKYAADIETSDRFLVEDLVTPDIAHVKGMLDANTEYRVDEVKLNKYTEDVTICRA